MAPRCLASRIVMGLVLVVAISPGAVEGSRLSRRLFYEGNVAEAAEVYGICAAFVTVHGYECQEIDVTTGDSYILNMQRISAGGSRGAGKPPVIIQHGILLDATTFMMNSPDKNLPMILADSGYDVWMANTRGTRFSRRHKYITARNPDYWDWSWEQLAAHELPAVFNYVHGETNQKINYIGHSLGTLTLLAALSQGALVHQLKSIALLSPITDMRHMATPILRVGAHIWAVEFSRRVGFVEFDPKGAPVGEFLDRLCSTPGVPSCYDLFSVLTGKSCCINASTIDLFKEYQPQSTSTKNMEHLSQLVRTGLLRKYDYGSKNFMKYGQLAPPFYDLSRITKDLPVFMSYGGNDAISDKLDVMGLIRLMKPREEGKLVVHFIPEYAHNDFVMGTNAKDRVYNKLISFLKQQ